MSTRRRRKCRHCGQLFRPDPRSVRHQRYCSAEMCRRASKAASQRRWLAKAAIGGDFRGVGRRSCPRVRLLRRGALVGALRQRPVPGIADRARRDTGRLDYDAIDDYPNNV